MAKGLLLLLCGFTTLFAGEKTALTFETMFTMNRISGGTLAPDGQRALYAVRKACLEGNSYSSRIFMVHLPTGDVKAMTPAGKNCSSPVWSADGTFFLFNMDGQIYKKAFDGSACEAVTKDPNGASGALLSKDGSKMIYQATISTLPEKPYDHTGKLIDSLFYKHWNRWVWGTRSHLFLLDLDSKEKVGSDITPGDFDTPPLDLGSSHDYDFSPDGKEVAFVKNTDEMVAISTNNDIFLRDLATGEERRLTEGKGNDASPFYSPDGRFIAFTSMARAGFEADQTVVTIYDRKNQSFKALTADADHSASGLVWLPDSSGLLYTGYHRGGRSIYQVDLNGEIKVLTKGTYDSGLSLDREGKTLLFHRQRTTMPTELFQMDLQTGAEKQVTFVNKATLDGLEMNEWESFEFKSPNGDEVQGFLIRPPFFDKNKKYPLVYLIHGGPQGMWSNDFHYRWNSQLFAAPGYVVALVNPHGSKGYGQAFCDAVSKDWGGLPYKDLMKGLDVVIERYPFIDGAKVGAAGASYGGYMINWIAGHTDRFNALVSHNGVFNMASMAGATEELWFSEWEFGGDYYEHPELYEKWSPHHYAKNFKTPTLVVHSEKDYRVPVNQGMELFTALQRQGVPSKWLYFPDEDHFVRKPLNAKMWWETVHGWFNTYLK